MAARLMLAAVALVAASTALAHTKLASSIPAAGAALDRAPTEVVLEFLEPVQLTAVTLTNGDAAAHALDALPSQRAARFTIGIRTALPPGSYRIQWRAVGADTHLVSGEIPFTIGGAAHQH